VGDDVAIRAETPADHDAIAAVVAAAFKSEVEAMLVADLRASEDFVPEWSLVAELDGRVVGHVMVTYAALRDADAGAEHRIPNLSPLAVHPAFQAQGIGGALVREVSRRVDEAGEPLVILQGSPKYYGRLGFEHSVRYGIEMALPSWAPAEAAQVLRLRAHDPAVRGWVVLPAPFDAADERQAAEERSGR
jgi:putative acetyltransferase